MVVQQYYLGDVANSIPHLCADLYLVVTAVKESLKSTIFGKFMLETKRG